jgi:predicted dehydrogenase
MARVTRRGFLRAGAAGGALLGLPAEVYRAAVLAQEKPSDQIRVGCIGVGGQGTANRKSFGKAVVAVCDVDKQHLASAAADLEKGGTKPQTFADYRHLLERKDVDAVSVSTPDHWHALPTIHACQAGKHVYCEKPLTLFVAEGRAMVTAARANKRVVQTGSQQRSGKEFRQACELVRNGAIGKVKQVRVGLPPVNWTSRAKGGKPVPDSAPPAGLNYEMWLGPAPERPFNENRVHYLFRFYWDYSGGQQTNFGAHDLDITQWALGMDDSGPTTIEGTGTFNKNGWYETPESATVTYTYANGVPVVCTLGKGGGGVTVEGEKGTVSVGRGRLAVTLNGEKVADPYKLATGDVKLYASPGHHKDFLDCIRTGKRPVADVEIGHRSATVCHLGNISIRLGRKLTWDPAKEEIVGDKEAAAMLSRPYRSPWKLG